MQISGKCYKYRVTERLNKGQQNVVQSERLTRDCIIFRFVFEWRKSDTTHAYI